MRIRADGGRDERATGVAIQRAWLRALGGITVLAFVSLGQQVDVLIGERGLLPVAELAAALEGRSDLSLPEFPTLFRWFYSEFWIQFFIVLGTLLGALAAAGWQARLCLGLCIPLYLSFAVGCQDFLAFQWDNMLLECLALAVFVPWRRRSRWVALALRVLLFKLYFESGIAKWQSYLGDWHDGSAMHLYYETAPINGLLGWWAHHLPAGWHTLESWAALVLELVVPLFIFGPRPLQLVAFASFTGFQLVNLATANYGFFVYLSLTLHLWLLRDDDLARAGRWASAIGRRSMPQWPRFAREREVFAASGSWMQGWKSVAAAALVGAYIVLSATIGVLHFTRAPGQCHPERLRCTERPEWVQRWVQWSAPWRAPIDTLRLVHAYHLFGHITRERIEPEFEVQVEGRWQAVAMRYKAGPLDRAPSIVAPHQPRVDFRLWFYGLSYRRGMPRYVRALLHKLCDDAEAMQPLFADRLPVAQAARIRFWRYRFTTPLQRWETGQIWQRVELAKTRPQRCLGP